MRRSSHDMPETTVPRPMNPATFGRTVSDKLAQGSRSAGWYPELMTAIRSERAQSLRLIMRDIDNRRAGAAVDFAECLHHRCPEMHVEIGKRFIKENDLCVRHQAPGEGDTLTLATGKFLDPPFGEAIKADTLENGVDAARRSRPWRPCVSSADRRHFCHIHMRPERIGLEDDTDTAFFRQFLLSLASATKLPPKR